MRHYKKWLAPLTVAAFSCILIGADSPDKASKAGIRNENLEKKLTKRVEKLKFAENGNRTKSKSGPTRFKSKYSDPKKATKEFIEKEIYKYGFSKDLDDIEITKVKKTPGGTIVHFQQLVDGIPVYHSNSSVTINNENVITWANVLYRPNARDKKGELKYKKTISSQKALKIAKDYIGIKGKILNEVTPEKKWLESEENGVLLVWEVNISTDNPDGDWQVIVHAEEGDVVQAQNLLFYADGNGMVFDPDPLKTARVPYGTPYVDSNDIDIPELNAQRKQVTLRDITKDSLYRLEGPFCVLTDIAGAVDTFPERSDSLFHYTRSQEEFEHVMCYYHLDKTARYLNELGYYDIALDSFNIDPHGRFDHNASFSYLNNNIRMGDGGIDAAEDGGVILHEYGHAIEHNIGPGLTSAGIRGEPRAVWEGSSDYWDVTYAASVEPFAWNRHGYWFDYGEGRPVDTALAYPQERFMYEAGPIWSSALMNIWWEVGKSTTDTLFLQTLTQLPIDPSLSGAAMAFIDAEYNIYNGLHREPILNAFDNWGLVQYINQVPFSVIDSTFCIINKPSRIDTLERNDDWDLPGTDGADNEHFLHLNHAANLNISTCSPATNFDTKIEVYDRNGISTGFFNDDAGCSSDPSHAALTEVSLPAGQYYIVVDGNNGSVGGYELSITYSRSLEIHIADQGYHESNIVKPMFYIVNTGTQSISDFSVSYYFATENNKTPVLDDYHTPNCTPSLENLGFGFYRVNFDFTGTTLLPGQRLPAGGEITVGIHYNDWSVWDKSNDFSQPGASLAISHKVAAFNSADELIYGRVPDLDPPAPPALNLEASILDEGYYEGNITKPRLYIVNKNDSRSLSDFKVKYYFTVENGGTPAIEDYWTPNCTVSLEHISGDQWCAVMDFAGYTLQPGGRVPADGGTVFGLHYSDWGTWNKSNDFSQPTSDSYTSTDRIAVFNSSGALVFGSHP